MPKDRESLDFRQESIQMDILRNTEDRLLADFTRYVPAAIELCGLSQTAVAKEAVGDGSFITDILSGKRKLTPSKYDTIIAWLDADMASKGKSLSKADLSGRQLAMPGLEPHPFAQLVPAMSAEMFSALLSDIAIHGVGEPIWRFGGKILDGRHRYAAAVKCGASIEIMDFVGTPAEALAFVVSANIHRRHLNASQRAMMGARIRLASAGMTAHFLPDMNAAMKRLIERPTLPAHTIWPPREGFPPDAPDELRALAQGRGIANTALLPIGDDADFDNQAAWAEVRALGVEDSVPKDEPVEYPGRLRGSEIREVNDIAEELGVSRNSIMRAETVVRKGIPKVVEAVEKGELGLKEGAAIARQPAEEQREAVEAKAAPKPRAPASDFPSLARLPKMLTAITDFPQKAVDELGAPAAHSLVFLLRNAAKALAALTASPPKETK